ncbi:2-amino-4-hydroxy-6-hydroxymethyldihydropteridine diphosphokinase [Croceibacterium atlanticum]|uniref:2-amino-4-hydroxy-6- hydroxymethyldihydropteridine diphosphokinase n=1 Tax=Croceibacterium atlanticum TaxID=1267766 RepID=UPI00062C96CA|nr:2-amino-4-hydroxy-6-hydroxymethyldihydropteridine diphosphokinase [Croceibacterium atlanticum]
MSHTYLIALGSNRRHHRFGRPRQVLATAMDCLDGSYGAVIATSPIVDSDPIGPSLRRYANAALLLRSNDDPEALLRRLKYLEQWFGRRQRGQRWSSRVLDLDIVLWDGGAYSAKQLTIPHPLFRERAFVLGPAQAIAPDWRDPVTGLTIYQLHSRLTRPRPLPRGASADARHPGPLAQSVEQLTFNQ